MKLFIFCGIQDAENQAVLEDYLQTQQQVNYLGQSGDLQCLLDLNSYNSQNQNSVASAKLAASIYSGPLEALTKLSELHIADTEIELVCFYSTPEFSYSKIKPDDEPIICSDDIITTNWRNSWLTTHQQRLDIAFTHTDNFLLINELTVFNDLTGFTKVISEQCGVAFAGPNELNLYSMEQFVQLSMGLVELNSDTELQQLFEQLESAAELLNTEFNPSTKARIEAYCEMISKLQYQGEQTKKRQQQELTELTAKISSLETKLSNLTTEHAELKNKNISAESEIQDLKSSLSECKSENTALTSENELALLQVHQLQEELEQTFLNSQKLESENNELVSSNLALESKASNLITLNTELESDKTTLQSVFSDRESENKLALLQVHHLQEELEQTFINAQKLETEKNSALIESGRNQMTNKKNKQLMDQLTVSNNKIESLSQNLEQQKSMFEENKAENELALLQVHQLQEELEHTFLKTQKLQNEKEELVSSISSLKSKVSNLSNNLTAKNNEQSELESDLESENELAILQIHQLQEELEYYYLKYQKESNWTPIPLETSAIQLHLQQTLQLLKR
ncbi:hypothetical protein [Shewanella sp. 6_MG-2023]|uniref:hypothetical protein n=1 Tax=Shewanella sp. 6_MG-2023 TaxID=3062660 RepID=UPI0026E316CD|nr:hypothetical protein [Shewanella sp. 6_MG-2023]MDO6617608.1 hypothetical protein [Shewanella sp. 6_MG-2023]